MEKWQRVRYGSNVVGAHDVWTGFMERHFFVPNTGEDHHQAGNTREGEDDRCNGGFLWTRPDVVFNQNLTDLITSCSGAASTPPGGGGAPSTPPAVPSPYRYSFLHKKYFGVDWTKMMWLSPICHVETPDIDPAVRTTGCVQEDFSKDPVLVNDILFWAPATLFRRATDSWRATKKKTPQTDRFSLVQLIRNHFALWKLRRLLGGKAAEDERDATGSMLSTMALPAADRVVWAEENLSFLVLNAKFDSAREKDWSPFLSMVARDNLGYAQRRVGWDSADVVGPEGDSRLLFQNPSRRAEEERSKIFDSFAEEAPPAA